MGAVKGLDRITEIVKKANDLVESGIAIRTNVEAIWETSQGIFDGALIEVKKVEDLVQRYEEDGISIEDLIRTKEVALGIKDFVIKCRNDVNSIYENTNEIKEMVFKIKDDANFIIKELTQWRQIKKELEHELNQTKLNILKALKTCQNMAKAKFKEAKEDFQTLQEVLDAVGRADFHSITEDQAASIKSIFKKLLKSDTFHIFTSKGHNQVDKMMDAIKSKLTGQLNNMLNSAVDYVIKSKEWEKIQNLEEQITTLIANLGKLLLDSDRKETKQQVTLEEHIQQYKDKIANYLSDKIDVVVDGAFSALAPGIEVAKKMFEAYKFASNVMTAFSNVPDSLNEFLPYTYTHDFLKDKEYNLFDYSIKIPIASIGWISVTCGAGISGSVTVSLAASGTIYNFLDPKQNVIVSGNVSGSALLDVEGHISIGVDLLGIIEAELRAALMAKASITDASGDIELQKETKNPGEAGIALASSATLTFSLEGALQFHIELTYFIRTLVKKVTGWDAQKTWTLAHMVLIEKTTTAGFQTVLTFDNKKLPDFGAIVDQIRAIGDLSTTAKEKIKAEIESKFGKKDKLEKAATGEPVTDVEVREMMAEYNIQLQPQNQSN